jgi:hypothetical protein
MQIKPSTYDELSMVMNAAHVHNQLVEHDFEVATIANTQQSKGERNRAVSGGVSLFHSFIYIVTTANTGINNEQQFK